MVFDLDEFLGVQDAEITSAERAALVRLQESRDFDVLCGVIGRYLSGRARNLASEPKASDWQTFELAKLQGAFGLFSRIVKLVRESEMPPAPKKK